MVLRAEDDTSEEVEMICEGAVGGRRDEVGRVVAVEELTESFGEKWNEKFSGYIEMEPGFLIQPLFLRPFDSLVPLIRHLPVPSIVGVVIIGEVDMLADLDALRNYTHDFRVESVDFILDDLSP